MAASLQRNLNVVTAMTLSPVAKQSKASLPAVTVRELSRRFGEREVLKSLDVDIAQGEFVALLGASGCGKSTLLRILADLDPEIVGEVEVRVRRAVAFQAPRLMPWKKVWRNVVLGLPGRATGSARCGAGRGWYRPQG